MYSLYLFRKEGSTFQQIHQHCHQVQSTSLLQFQDDDKIYILLVRIPPADQGNINFNSKLYNHFDSAKDVTCEDGTYQYQVSKTTESKNCKIDLTETPPSQLWDSNQKDHFKKHGEEFPDAKNQKDYTELAKQFAEDDNNCVLVTYTKVKSGDEPTREVKIKLTQSPGEDFSNDAKILVAKKKKTHWKIATFYKWNKEKFPDDPMMRALFNTRFPNILDKKEQTLTKAIEELKGEEKEQWDCLWEELNKKPSNNVDAISPAKESNGIHIVNPLRNAQEELLEDGDKIDKRVMGEFSSQNNEQSNVQRELLEDGEKIEKQMMERLSTETASQSEIQQELLGV